jgi:hypothetical protein
MPCEVVPLRVDFFKMTKMLKKNEKHKNDHSRLLAEQKLMKLDRNNIRKHRSPQTTPISEFGHVDASFIITNQFLTSKYS